MTEDDTFRVLARPTLDEVFMLWMNSKKRASLLYSKVRVYQRVMNEFYKAYGWIYDEKEDWYV